MGTVSAMDRQYDKNLIEKNNYGMAGSDKNMEYKRLQS